MTLAELIQHILDGKLSEGMLGQALVQLGAPCVYNGERWFALPTGGAPKPQHIPFWVPRYQIGTLETEQVPDNASDDVLSAHYGVKLAKDINVTIGVPPKFATE